VTSEALYEQYKDALKRGHVAALRGQIDAALLAYAEAARIAPERSTPHSSAGTALLRRNRPAEALRQYDVALSLTPRDEAALLGRAQALMALDRRGDAADAFDALAEVQAAAGRLADAVDAARRGLELAEGRERRRTLERLIARLRTSEPDEPGRVALERALQVLEGVAVPLPPTGTTPGAPGPAGRPAGAGQSTALPGSASPASEPPPPGEEDLAEPSAPDTPPGPGETWAAPPAAETVGPADAVPAPGPVEMAATPDAGVSAAEPAAAPEAPAPAAEPAEEPRAGAAVEAAPPVSGGELTARAEAAAAAGEPGPAVEATLALAAFHAREGRIDAALDACYAALTFDPDNVGLHLALVELYAGRGWNALATEKLALLDRIARLDEDGDASAAIAGARASVG
jgi:tetratricopeptide (TPR) repeat protein